MPGLSQHRPLTSTPTTEPELICHPQSSLPMLEPPVTTWMGDAVDKEGTLSRMASPCGLPLDSRGLHGRLGWDGESTAGSSRAARGTEGQEGPRQPAPPASWCHRGGWGQLADGEPWAQRASDFHLRAMALEVGLSKHASSWWLLLSLGSRGRVRGAADHFQGWVMPGKTCYVFTVGQNGLTGLGCSR